MVRWVVRLILQYEPIEPKFLATDVTKVVLCGTLSGMVHIKDTLLLIGKSSPSSGGSRFLVSLLKWSFLIFTTPYNRKLKKYVICVITIFKMSIKALQK